MTSVRTPVPTRRHFLVGGAVAAAATALGLGALPEKVLSDGSPAAVAPLAWTSSLVTATPLRLPR